VVGAIFKCNSESKSGTLCYQANQKILDKSWAMHFTNIKFLLYFVLQLWDLAYAPPKSKLKTTSSSNLCEGLNVMQ
jgi:hypothetical protein